MGGGVMSQAALFPLIRRGLADSMNRYVQTAALSTAVDRYVVPPGLGVRAGVLGALALAIDTTGLP
jgi:fructokinase